MTDCSQTLYEFRASNPRALNILEASQVFQAYQLTTNYRSNQEILDFANVALEQIEANQYAQIRLHANSLVPVTEQSFMDKVQLNYNHARTVAEMEQNIPAIFASDLKPYLDACLARGEQVAFLAHKRVHVGIFRDVLAQQYPSASCVNLMPDKPYPSTVMSQFIRNRWKNITFAPYTAIPAIIYQEIMSHIGEFTRNPKKAGPAIQRTLQEWIQENGPAMDYWIKRAINGLMTEQELLDNIKDCMLKFEISKNAVRQTMVSNRNREAKLAGAAANANFLLSTIHSAKGLEFQNVVLLYLASNDMDEADKRMYYVAMTRAMNSEYILAFGNTMSSRIQTEYLDVLQRLHAIAPSPNSIVPMMTQPIPRNKRIKI